MLVRNAMQTSTVTIDAQDALPKAVIMMQTLGVRRLLVLSDGLLVGLLTDGQVARALPQISGGRTPWEFLFLAGSLRVGEVMRREVEITRPDDDLNQAIQAMLDKHVGGLPVLYEDGTLVGILTLTDVLRAAVKPGPGGGSPDWDTSGWDAPDLETPDEKAGGLGTVRDHMSEGAVTVSPDMPLSEAAARLVVTRLKVLPVTQGRTLLGVLHQQDIQAALDHQQVGHGNDLSGTGLSDDGLPGNGLSSAGLSSAGLHGPAVMENHFFLRNRTVLDLMCPPGAEVLVDAPLTEAIQAMLDADVHGLPVVTGDQHEFLGVITVSDVLRALLTRGQGAGRATEANGAEPEPLLRRAANPHPPTGQPSSFPAEPTPAQPTTTGDD